MAAITGARTEGWRLDAVTPTGALVAKLPLLADTGSHDWSLDRPIPLGIQAVVDVVDRDGEPTPDLEGLWLKVSHRINGETYTVATVVATSQRRILTHEGEVWSVAGSDPTVLLQERAKLRRGLVLPEGTPVAEQVRALLAEYAPGVRVQIGDTDETLRTHLAFDPGTPVLDPINKLLEAAAYTQLAPTVDGGLWSRRWQPSSERSSVLDFAGHAAQFLPNMDIGRELTTPNEVIAIGQGGQQNAGVVGRWPDFEPSPPVTEVIEVEATTVEAATLLARQRLEELQSVARTTSAEGPWQPIIPGDVTDLSWVRHNLSGRFEVTDIRTAWTLGAPTGYTMRGV